MACVCGTDKAYAANADLPARLKQAGARRVLLAGPPDDALTGVDTFLYRGCDALDVLRVTLEALS